MAEPSRTRPAVLIAASSVGLFFAAWEALSRSGWVNPVLISSPSRIARTIPQLLGDPTLGADAAHTFGVFAAAVSLALCFGTGTGLLIGYSRAAASALSPFIFAFNALPKIVLIPLLVLWLGVGWKSNLALAAFMASFPVITATHSAVRSLERDLVLVARAFGATRWKLLRSIVMPGITPYLLAGLKVGINYAMVGVLIGEFFASSQGIGYRMLMGMQNFEVDAFFSSLLLVAGFVLLCIALVSSLERRVQSWRPSAL